MSGRTLRVVTWNIAFGVEIDGAIEVLVSDPELNSADLVLLQEMDRPGTSAIAGALGMDHVYASSGVHAQSGRDFGNAVLSAWTIRDGDVVGLPHRSRVRGHDRSVTRGVVTIDEVDVSVGSVHAEVPTLGNARRREQFEHAAAVFGGRPWSPAIVGGDFNTITPGGVAVLDTAFAEVGFRRASEGADPTLSRGGVKFGLDHVFARDFRAVEVAVRPHDGASDHHPLRVDLLLDP